MLEFRLKAFVRCPNLVEWEQMEAFDLFFFYRSVPTMEDIQGLADKLTNEDFQRFRLLSFADVEDKSLIFHELCNPWYRLHNNVNECHQLMPKCWSTLDILQRVSLMFQSTPKFNRSRRDSVQ